MFRKKRILKDHHGDFSFIVKVDKGKKGIEIWPLNKEIVECFSETNKEKLTLLQKIIKLFERK